MEKVLPHVDTVLHDYKLTDPERHKKWCGADNRRIRANFKKPTRRFPTRSSSPAPRSFPGVNDDEEHIRAVLAFIKPYKNVIDYELLPYIRFGESKYGFLGRVYEMQDFTSPSPETLKRLRAIIDQGLAAAAHRSMPDTGGHMEEAESHERCPRILSEHIEPRGNYLRRWFRLQAQSSMPITASGLTGCWRVGAQLAAMYRCSLAASSGARNSPRVCHPPPARGGGRCDRAAQCVAHFPFLFLIGHKIIKRFTSMTAAARSSACVSVRSSLFEPSSRERYVLITINSTISGTLRNLIGPQGI